MRRLWAGGKYVQHFPALLFALRLDVASQDKFRTRLVHARVEAEAHALFRLVDGPAGKNLGHFCDISLRVSAVHAQRVEFEKFATVVFVESAVLLALAIGIRSGTDTGTAVRSVADNRPLRHSESLHGIGSDAHPVIEVVQHGRTLG